MPLPPTIPIVSSNSTTAKDTSSFAPLKALAFDAGFDLCEITRPVISERDQSSYEEWLGHGFHAEMAYMSRNAAIRKNPRELHPLAQSVIVVGVSYYQGDFPEKPGQGFGRVARYAWGLDYHDIIRTRLEQLAVAIEKYVGYPCHPLLANDTKPLLERSLASSAGLGFVGKNTLLISSRPTSAEVGRFHVGSFLFLAEILIEADLGQASPPQFESGCGSCTNCLTACPTSAFEGPYQLNANRCISYLTIENKGWIDRSLRPLMEDWIFGCDRCQEVCPFNARTFAARWPEFDQNKGVGPWMSVSGLLLIGDSAQFKKRFAATPVLRTKRTGLLRNACVVAGNSQDESLVPVLKNVLQDPEPLLRGHALWALGQLSQSDACVQAETLLRQETDVHVIEECHAVLNK